MNRAAAACALALLVTSCQKEDAPYTDGVVQVERGELRGKAEMPDARIEELKKEIRRYRAVVDKKVEASEQAGIYYKMLAVAYMRKQMYQAAYESLVEAMRYHPSNSVLFYYAGVSAGQVSRGAAGSDKTLWLERAEAHYRRAIEIDADYVEAMYGLAVLDTFELGKLADAEALARRILALQSRSEEASFLLANILYRSGRLADAATLYRQIADTAQVEASRAEALKNKARIEKEMRGGP